MNELLETLAKYNCQVEQIDGKIIITPKNQFKRGDILWSEELKVFCVFYEYNIYNTFHSLFNTSNCDADVNENKRWSWSIDKFTLATEEQLVEFNDKLAKEGKQWNAKTYEIEELQPKFKRGDILVNKASSKIYIFKEFKSNEVFFDGLNEHGCDRLDLPTSDFRLATDKEKQEFFNELTRNDKRWNAETCIIETIEPFNHGDILRSKDYHTFCIYDHGNKGSFRSMYDTSDISSSSWWTECFRLATEEEKQLFFDKLKENGKRWNEETCELEDLKWKPEKGEKYFYPYIATGTNFKFVTDDTVWKEDPADFIIRDNGHICKSKEDCDDLCDKLNDAIKKVR